MLLHYLFLLLLLLNENDSRKSDYKQIIFSDNVKNEMESKFQNQLQEYNTTQRNVFQLYEKLWETEKDAKLVRLQPEKVLGSVRNITITNNRKSWVSLKTTSKRRPLMFQIDDFLFDDECEHIKNVALKYGLENSLTESDAEDAANEFSTQYDGIEAMEFTEFDYNNDSVINMTEMQKAFRYHFDVRFGSLMMYEMMRKSYIDFNLDGKIEPWEWNLKNGSYLISMLSEEVKLNPASKARFSETQWLKQTDSNDTVLLSIQDRLHKVTGLPLAMIRTSELLQVVKYKPGGHYDCHLDSDPSYYAYNYEPCCHLLNANDNVQHCSACRFMTVLFYLDDTELGGETAFPVVGVDPYKNKLANENGGSDEDWCDLSVHCSMAKVVVKPKKGRAVLWYNHFIDPDTEWTGAVDHNSLHGGCAVIQGTKWIANNWINSGHHKQHDVLSWAYNIIIPESGPEEEINETEIDESLP